MISRIVFGLAAVVHGENVVAVLNGVVDFPAVILLVGNYARNSLSIRMDGELLRTDGVETLGAELHGDHGIFQQKALVVQQEGIVVPLTF